MTRDDEITGCAMALMASYPEPDALKAYFEERGASLARAKNWPAHTALFEIAAKCDEMRGATAH